jgi:hypothetical protein
MNTCKSTSSIVLILHADAYRAFEEERTGGGYRKHRYKITHFPSVIYSLSSQRYTQASLTPGRNPSYSLHIKQGREDNIPNVHARDQNRDVPLILVAD